jgi:protein SCO1
MSAMKTNASSLNLNANSDLAVGIGHKHSSDDCVLPVRGPDSEYFPNLVVETHDGQKALFYGDLLRGKTVLISSMSVQDADCVVTKNLLKVQQLLGSKLGENIFIYSITSDPEHDTADALRRFAEARGVHQGWWFVTGKPETIQIIRQKLFTHAHPETANATEDCSMMMLRYGNEKFGIWGSVPGTVGAEWIVTRLSWLQPRAKHVGPPVRKGPFPKRNV